MKSAVPPILVITANTRERDNQGVAINAIVHRKEFMMVALKEEYSTHVAFHAGEHTLASVSLRPVRQTIWRRKHDIRPGGAPHFYMGAMSPELTPDNEVRVGYRNRLDDPTEAGYEYVGFIYRGFLRFDDLPHEPTAEVAEAVLSLCLDETLWQLNGNPARKLVSAAGHLLVLEAPLQKDEGAFFTPAYVYSALPNEVGTLEQATFTLQAGLRIDVKPLVQAWMRGEKPNHGLVLMGPNEDFEHNDNYQESTYGETVLTISYQIQR
jgi:hypothetical protein